MATVSTVKKSQAIMLFAWRRINSRQETPPRCPAGPRPAPTRTFRTLVGWTSFSGVFSTVFPLVVLIAILACYAVASRRHS